VDLPSRLALYSIGRNYVLQRATKIDPGQIDTEGSDVNIFVGSNSVVADTIVKQLGYSVAKLFLDGATGDDLDRLAFDRYNLTRKGAAAALGACTFTRVAFTAGAGIIPAGTALQALNGSQYITTSVANFGATSLTSAANIRAVQAGKAAQVGTNALTAFTNQGAIFDRSITVTNALATAGGEDVEPDDTFRSRIRTFWNTARRGILSAIVQGALSVPGVVSAQAIEALNTQGQPARLVLLYIADSTGVANLQLAQAVQVALNDYRAAGIFVSVQTSLPQIVGIVLNLVFQANIDTTTLGNLVQAAVVSYVNSLPVNGTLTLAGLYSVLQRFVSQGLIVSSGVSSGTIVSPIGDLVPMIGQTLRTTTANVQI
jgi:hypothetical protein